MTPTNRYQNVTLIDVSKTRRLRRQRTTKSMARPFGKRVEYVEYDVICVAHRTRAAKLERKTYF